MSVPEDIQLVAVRRFWETQRFETLKDARLVSFGLCVPVRNPGVSIMDDRQRFRAVLDKQSGVDQWLDEPRWYRRCYQGLVRSYFIYDCEEKSTSTVGKQNWGDLRDYLHSRVDHIVDDKVNPDWVTTTAENRQLFGSDPCAPYASAVLDGDTAFVDRLCEQLGIFKASWFLRELVLAQIREATKLGHQAFTQRLPQLLKMLASNLVLCDRGLIRLLDRYVDVPQHALHPQLRDAAVERWGNPWLPSNEMRWGGVVPAAREMVSEWLKREFIEAFFTKLAQDGLGDRRRAEFWLRYTKSMDNIQFALGTTALYSNDRDFVALRKKMAGLFTELRTSDSQNNAFVMTLGDLVAVEFGAIGNAFYGYDTRQDLPFDLSKPVLTTKNVRNSLKHDRRILWLGHKDGIRGWDTWEEMFEATLGEHFGIKPNKAAQEPQRTAPVRSVSADSRTTGLETSGAPPFSRTRLSTLAANIGFLVDDLSHKNGNLWVRFDDSNPEVNRVLTEWGFTYKGGKGWWR